MKIVKMSFISDLRFHIPSQISKKIHLQINWRLEYVPCWKILVIFLWGQSDYENLWGLSHIGLGSVCCGISTSVDLFLSGSSSIVIIQLLRTSGITGNNFSANYLSMVHPMKRFILWYFSYVWSTSCCYKHHHLWVLQYPLPNTPFRLEQ